MDLEKKEIPTNDDETLRDLHEILALREKVTKLSQQLGHDVPKVDLVDEGNSYTLVMELPGVSQDNLEIAIQGREVTVAGIRESFVEPNIQDTVAKRQKDAVMNERYSGLVQRSIGLPEEILRDEATAHLREGLLVLYLPKRLED